MGWIRKFKSNAKQDINDLPTWVQKYPESVINSLGGPALLKELIATRGEAEAKVIVEMLGDGLMQEIEIDESYESEHSFSQKR